MPERIATGNSIAVFDGDEKIYQRDPSPLPAAQDWTVDSQIKLPGAIWNLRVWPTRQLTAQLDTLLPEIVLIVGLVIAFLLSAAVRLTQVARIQVGKTAEAEGIQRHLNKQLAETLALQNAVFRSANYAIISTNPMGMVTAFNATAERWLGYTAAEVVGKVTPALWHVAEEVEARAQALSLELGRAIEPGFESFAAKPRLGLVDENEWTFIRKDGSRFLVSLSATALFDSAGTITGFLGMIADITERKKSETALRESEERFRLVVEGVMDYAILMLDPEGRVSSWNSGAARIKGYQAEEIIGQHFSKFYPPEALAIGKPARELVETLARGHFEDEGWRVRKDGSLFYANVLITAIYDSSGRHRGFGKVTRDITESNRARERLRESEERFRRAFDSAPIGMALVSPEGRWIKVNRVLCDMIGYSETDLLQTDFQHITHPDDLGTDLEFVRQMLAGKILSYQMEKRYFHKNGATVNVMLSVALVRDSSGEPLHFISQMEDITERKLTEVKLAEQAAELKRSNQELKDVLEKVKILSGMLPICGSCKKIRDDTGYWNQIETYITQHSDASFSHGLCPECAIKALEAAGVPVSDKMRKAAGQ